MFSYEDSEEYQYEKDKDRCKKCGIVYTHFKHSESPFCSGYCRKKYEYERQGDNGLQFSDG